ncbi:hypothetical protein FACS1894158_09500 [Betaproteobacteria bacterium]|nr:hypothetical protein FACS1894158_09500 [Betaproteobacteria bacterium]
MSRYLRYLLYIALSIINLFGCATRFGNENGTHDALRLSCPDAVYFFSENELKEIGKKELESRGGSFSDDWLIKVVVRHCDYHVYFDEIPARPGSYFGVFISSKTGNVTKFIGGR